MKGLITIFFLIICLSVYAQKRNSDLLNKNDGTARVQYFGSSELTGSSEAVVIGEVSLIHTTQFLPLDNAGKIVGRGDSELQISQIFRNISPVLKRAGSGIDQIVKINIFVRELDIIPKMQAQISKRFQTGKKPSVSFVAGDLVHKDALVAMDVIAVSTLNYENSVKYISSAKSFSAIQPAQASVLSAGPVVYVSGQAAKGKIAEATHATLVQLQATLHELGLKKKDIIQVKSFLNPMSEINTVEKEFAAFFDGEIIPPLVFADWISNDPVIEIELIAAAAGAPIELKAQLEFITPEGMSSSPVYSKVTRLNYGKKVYISTLFGNRSENEDTELIGIFSSLNKILNNTGSDFRHLVKATYYLDNDKYSKSLNELRPKYYDPKRPPAASKAIVKGVGLNGAGISIDMIGVIADK